MNATCMQARYGTNRRTFGACADLQDRPATIRAMLGPPEDGDESSNSRENVIQVGSTCKILMGAGATLFGEPRSTVKESPATYWH